MLQWVKQAGESIKAAGHRIIEAVSPHAAQVATVAVVGAAVLLPAVSFADTIFPVSADVATIKADLLLWMTAFIGVTLAIYGFFKIKRVAR